MKKGQETPEFIIILGLLMFILLIVVVMYGDLSMSSEIAKGQMIATRTNHALAYAINAVAEGGDGSSYVLYVMGDDTANMTISGRVLYLNYSGGMVSAPLTTNRTSAPAIIPVNSYINVSNSNGLVTVTPM